MLESVASLAVLAADGGVGLISVGEIIATDRTRPDWQRFEDMAAKYDGNHPTRIPHPTIRLSMHLSCVRLAMRS